MVENKEVNTERPSRKQRLRYKNPDKFRDIVRIATEILATQGYSATNMAHVAKAAGVGVGTLYSYFDDKEDLFLTCVEAASGHDHQAKKEKLDPNAPALRMLKDIMQVDQELAVDDPAGQKLLRSIFYGVNSHLRESLAAQSLYMGSMGVVEQALRKGEAEGVLTLWGEPRVVALLINGLMETFHVLGGLASRGDSASTKAELTEKAFEILCKGILKTKEGKIDD